MTWINDFENEFNIHAQSDEFKLIIGIRPYKQELGNKKLAVDKQLIKLCKTLYIMALMK